MKQILLSDLALNQLKEMPSAPGRQLLVALERLRTFPESAPRLTLSGYETYRQVIVSSYRAVYRYFSDTDEVRVYCIIHERRRLPSPEYLTHQIF